MSQVNVSEAPRWCGELEQAMEQMARDLLRDVRGWDGPETVFTPEAFGYVPGEMATVPIQRAGDAASEHGGVVLLAQGDYVSGTVVMRSGVCLEIRAGARLLGSTDLRDYPEHRARRLTVQDTSMGMHPAISACGAAESLTDAAIRAVFRERKPPRERPAALSSSG